MPFDPNRVSLTGENPFIHLKKEANSEITSRASFWRILLSPKGPGHILFIEGELTGTKPKIYSDNIAMSRWLQGEIEIYLHPPFGDEDIPVIDAVFQSSGDLRAYWTETVMSRDDEIALTWYDFGEPSLGSFPVGSLPSPFHGVYSVMIPAAGARLVVNGQFAQGRAFPDEGEMSPGSTCCLALSETWVRS